MKNAKIENNIVVQIQPNEENGFIKVEDYVICGMIKQQDNSFSNPIKTVQEIEIEDNNNKWQIVNNYLANEIPNIENTSASGTTHTFIVTLGSIEEIKQIANSNVLTEEHEFNWVQLGIPTFITTKAELKIVYLEWKKLEQEKINQVFGIGV